MVGMELQPGSLHLFSSTCYYMSMLYNYFRFWWARLDKFFLQYNEMLVYMFSLVLLMILKHHLSSYNDFGIILWTFVHCNVASGDFWRSFPFKLFFASLQNRVQGERSVAPTPNNRSESWRESSYSTFTSTRTDACSCLTFCVSQIGVLLLLSVNFNALIVNFSCSAQFFWTSLVAYTIIFLWH